MSTCPKCGGLERKGHEKVCREAAGDLILEDGADADDPTEREAFQRMEATTEAIKEEDD